MTSSTSNAVKILELEELPIIEDIDNKIIDEYKKLNEKCDIIISKIKTRKENRNKK